MQLRSPSPFCTSGAFLPQSPSAEGTHMDPAIGWGGCVCGVCVCVKALGLP